MKIADNEIARAYDSLQNSVDWGIASDAKQLNTLQEMKQLLIHAPIHTPIFDFGTSNSAGVQSVRNAAEQINYIISRISRLECA